MTTVPPLEKTLGSALPSLARLLRNFTPSSVEIKGPLSLCGLIDFCFCPVLLNSRWSKVGGPSAVEIFNPSLCSRAHKGGTEIDKRPPLYRSEFEKRRGKERKERGRKKIHPVIGENRSPRITPLIRTLLFASHFLPLFLAGLLRYSVTRPAAEEESDESRAAGLFNNSRRINNTNETAR